MNRTRGNIGDTSQSAVGRERAEKSPPSRNMLHVFVGRVLCRVHLHKWCEIAKPGLGLLTYYRCARCGVTGESHVTDEGDIYEHAPNK